jgi:hypothetical protein
LLERNAEFVSYSADGSKIILVSKFDVEVRDATARKILHRVTILEIIRNETRTVAVSTATGQKTMKVKTFYEFHGPAALAPDSQSFAIVCVGRHRRTDRANFKNFDVIRFYDIPSKEKRRGHDTYPFTVNSLSLSPDGTLLAIPHEGVTLLTVE